LYHLFYSLSRYAILSVLPYYLTLIFNRLIERSLLQDSPGIITTGIEEGPKTREKMLEEELSWVMEVPELERTLVTPAVTGKVPCRDYLSAHFMVMNILVEKTHVSFV